MALITGKGNLAKFLITEGIDTHVKTDYDETPLMMVIEFCELRVVEMIIDKDVDLKVVRKDGLRAIHIAYKVEDDINKLKLLLKARAKFYTPGMTPFFDTGGGTKVNKEAIIRETIRLQDIEGLYSPADSIYIHMTRNLRTFYEKAWEEMDKIKETFIIGNVNLHTIFEGGTTKFLTKLAKNKVFLGECKKIDWVELFPIWEGYIRQNYSKK